MIVNAVIPVFLRNLSILIQDYLANREKMKQREVEKLKLDESLEKEKQAITAKEQEDAFKDSIINSRPK